MLLFIFLFLRFMKKLSLIFLYNGCYFATMDNEFWEGMAIFIRQDPEKSRENVMKAAQIHLVVAALIMTVTFTAGFTLPGGFDSDSVSLDKGMAILLRSRAFGAFVVTNAIAFTCSAAAVFTYFAMGASITHVPGSVEGLMVTELIVILRLYKIASYLQFVAMSAVVIAFVTGTYATLAHSVGLAGTVCVIGCSSFLMYVLVIVIWLQLV
ncbi:protein ACCELERATED CELL DEATH 6-like [Solanum dulcamara]|uniref:protein ACCELERATED CELL DEATH 6-like n=1 Tax=Solanum dulcamara TaxID=45834 RepID=UPI0024851BD6|nr:protein ACCELERATED CELL DEATH 6-like [Solanum dulcamara]